MLACPLRIVASLGLVLFAAIIAGCNHYTIIDSKHWVAFSDRADANVISYSVPGGYVEQPLGAATDATTLRVLDYDVLSGPNIYGAPWGETRLSFSVRRTDVPLEEVATSIAWKTDYPPPTERMALAGGWHQTVFDNWAFGWMTRWYVYPLAPHRYLLLTEHLEGPVYTDKRLRAQRIRMVEDILHTVVVKAE